MRNEAMGKDAGKTTIRVGYYGTYDLSEPHNSTYLAALRAVGAEVIECRAAAVRNRAEVRRYRNPIALLAFVARLLSRSFFLFVRLWRIGPVDGVIVGYPGYFDLPLAALFCRIRGVPLLFNVHISLYETLVLDRGIFRQGSLFASALRAADRFLFRLSDVVIVDTEAHGAFFAKLYRLPRSKFKRVFIGADAIFSPRKVQKKENTALTVLFYGSFIPLQGIEYIVEAAHLLRKENDLRFEIIGRGQTREEILQLARRLETKNIDFVEWLTLEELVQRIARADICLGGQFGKSEKADLVIGYKCFQMLAMHRPVVVADSRGNRELLTNGVDCLMCPAGDAKALAERILQLKRDPALRDRLARNAGRTFEQNCSPEKIGARLVRLITGEEPAEEPPVADTAPPLEVDAQTEGN